MLTRWRYVSTIDISRPLHPKRITVDCSRSSTLCTNWKPMYEFLYTGATDRQTTCKRLGQTDNAYFLLRSKIHVVRDVKATEQRWNRVHFYVQRSDLHRPKLVTQRAGFNTYLRPSLFIVMLCSAWIAWGTPSLEMATPFGKVSIKRNGSCYLSNTVFRIKNNWL